VALADRLQAARRAPRGGCPLGATAAGGTQRNQLQAEATPTAMHATLFVAFARDEDILGKGEETGDDGEAREIQRERGRDSDDARGMERD